MKTLRELTGKESLVQRRWQVDTVGLLWVPVLPVTPRCARHLAKLHRSCEKTTGCRLAYSAFPGQLG